MLVAPGQKDDWQVDGKSRGEKNDKETAGKGGDGDACGGFSLLAQVVVKNRVWDFLVFIVATVWDLFEIAQNKDTWFFLFCFYLFIFTLLDFQFFREQFHSGARGASVLERQTDSCCLTSICEKLILMKSTTSCEFSLSCCGMPSVSTGAGWKDLGDQFNV